MRKNRILIVDDEQKNVELCQDYLELAGHESESASNGVEALNKISHDIDLVLLDVKMPKMNGFETAKRIRIHPEYQDIPIIIVTALDSKEDRLMAVEVGANDFISKPIDKTELNVRLNSLLKMKDAQDKVKKYQENLEQQIADRTKSLTQTLKRLEEANKETQRAHLDTIRRLVLAAEYKDDNTASHLQRISHFSAVIARALGLSQQEVALISFASQMHDVGKISIPDSILLKPGKLDAGEWKIMKKHAMSGARMLRDSPSMLLQIGEKIALTHHEKWDGTGYPRGLVGEQIPLAGRICAIVDAFDALTSQRPYKKAVPDEEALQIIREAEGKHFDPTLVDLFVQNFDHVLEIKNNLKLEAYDALEYGELWEKLQVFPGQSKAEF